MIIDITYSGEKPDKKTVVALGVFDGIHLGHRAILKKAQEQIENGYDFLLCTFASKTVTTKTDNGALEVLLSDEEKKNIAQEFSPKYIYSPKFSEIKDFLAETFVKQILIKKLNAGIVVCGSDFHFGKGGFADTSTLKTLCESYGVSVIEVKPVLYEGEKISSTTIRKCIQKGDIKLANTLLGYNYFYYLTVMHGNEIGRTLDFPTINQEIIKGKILPKFGVYITRTFIDGSWHKSISNVGIKPTIEIKSKPLIETNIFGYCGNAYDKKVKVELLDFLRAEAKFDSVNNLKDQIKKDIEKTNKYFERVEYNNE